MKNNCYNCDNIQDVESWEVCSVCKTLDPFKIQDHISFIRRVFTTRVGCLDSYYFHVSFWKYLTCGFGPTFPLTALHRVALCVSVFVIIVASSLYVDSIQHNVPIMAPYILVASWLIFPSVFGFLYVKYFAYSKFMELRKRVNLKIIRPREWIMKCYGPDIYKTHGYHRWGSPVDRYMKLLCQNTGLEYSNDMHREAYNLGLHISHGGGFAKYVADVHFYLWEGRFQDEPIRYFPTYSFLSTYRSYVSAVKALGRILGHDATKTDAYKLFNFILSTKEFDQIKFSPKKHSKIKKSPRKLMMD